MTKHLPLLPPTENADFEIDWNRLEDAIGPKTRLIILNFPHNPTATVVEKDFFIDIHQKHLNVLRLRLTDSKNRSIGRNPYRSSELFSLPDHNITEPGLNPNHSTLGNLSFSAVIRIDTIKTKKIEHLETLHHAPSVPARFSNGIVNQLNDVKQETLE